MALLVYVQLGSMGGYTISEVAREVLRGPRGEGALHAIVWEIRLPRACVALLAGGLLAAVGSVFQALLRNPLADPYVLGVSSGAAIGGALAVAFGFGGLLGGMGMLGAGFAGGMLSLLMVVALARRRGLIDVNSLLLAGVTVGALLSALLSFVLLYAGQDTNRILGFLLGHTSDADWLRARVLALSLALGLAILYPQARRLNAFALGGPTAQRLGVDVPRLTRWVLVVGTAMTAAAVGAIGIVGFVGLVAPHIARRLVGVDWRISLPTSTLVGMVVMLVADLLGQRLLPWLTGTPGMEVNVGIVAAILGAPSLLILLRRAASPR